LAEGSEETKEAEKHPSDETLEDFREEIEEQHGPDGLDGRLKDGSTDDPSKPGDAPIEAQGEANLDLEESHERPLTGADLEEARRQILEQYGQDGLEAPDPPITESELDDWPDVNGTAGKKDEPAAPEEPHPDLPEKAAEAPPVMEDGASMGSFSRNDNQTVVTEQEQGGDRPGNGSPDSTVETSDLQCFPADSEAKVEPETETRTLEAVDYGKGAVVRVPKTDLEGGGYDPPDHNTVVQLGLRDVESDDVETVFARYNASDRRAEVYVGDVGGEKGSKYELVEAMEYDEDRFARDFERGRCEHIQNVKLEHVEERMFVNIDDRRVELEDHRLATSGSHVILRGKLDGEDGCKIEFDGRHSSFKFGRDYPVEGMKMEGDDLVVRYSQSWNEKHERRLHLEHLEAPERPSLNQFGREEMLDHVKMFDRPEGITGLHQFVIDRETQSEIRRLLDDAKRRGGKQYEATKAEISETLVPNLLEVCGWKRIERHPFSTKDKDGVSANGTDWLMQAPDGKVLLMEVKWYQNREDAIRKASTQVEKDFLQHREDSHWRLEGAYIAIMDYYEESANGRPIRIHILRVRPKEELK
jgi:hypothetical protein